MAQVTNNPTLQSQINAGVQGRQHGHSYESILADRLNKLPMPFRTKGKISSYLVKGRSELILLNKVMDFCDWNECCELQAFPTGRLATAENGTKELFIDGVSLRECKSDVIIKLKNKNGENKIVGVSVKQCNNRTPTNAQVFFSTATAFYRLVIESGFKLTDKALEAMKQFCGDSGFRPIDIEDCSSRISTPERYFWEEVDTQGRKEWEELFSSHQDEITKILLQKGYAGDPFPPQVILHKTKKSTSNDEEIAIFTMDEFIQLSHEYSPFAYSKYRVKKGSHKEPKGIEHLAPRFGVVQMQRGGQKQHPTQLQFNLKAGYFYHTPFSNTETEVS